MLKEQTIRLRIAMNKKSIANHEKTLAASDYKIIKAAEYAAAGQEPPYDMAALHAERQCKRDRINALKTENEELAARLKPSVKENA